MVQKNIREKWLLLKALEDGVMKAVELSAAGVVVGLEPSVILLSSAAVFAGSFTYKLLSAKMKEN